MSPTKRLPPTKQTQHDFRKDKFYKTIEKLHFILAPGIAAELIGLALLHAFHLGPNWEKIVYISPIIVILPAYILFNISSSEDIKRHLRYSPWLFVVILSIALSISYYQIYNFNKDHPEYSWSKKIVKDTQECGHEHTDKEIDCIFSKLDTYRRSVTSSLASELETGDTLMANSEISWALLQRFGVRDTFLGMGMSLPQDAENERAYYKARIPEYLIPNKLTRNNSSIWSWKVNPSRIQETLDKPMNEFLSDAENLPEHWNNTVKELNHQASNDESRLTPMDVLKKNDAKHLELNDSTPIIIRFAQFPASDKSEKLGRDEATWVFGCHLGDILANNLTLREALAESGYQYDPKKGDQPVFIWVFFPSGSDEVVPATWPNVLSLVQKEPH